MPPRKPGELRPKEFAFLSGIKKGLSPTAACKEAGYADWKGESDRLLARPDVRDHLVKMAGEMGVKWTLLVSMLKRHYFRMLSNTEILCPNCKSEVLVPAAKDSDINKASDTILKVVSALKGQTLEDKLATADKPRDKKEAALAFLGEFEPSETEN